MKAIRKEDTEQRVCPYCKRAIVLVGESQARQSTHSSFPSLPSSYPYPSAIPIPRKSGKKAKPFGAVGKFIHNQQSGERRSWNSWKSEELREIKVLREHGHSIKQIAEMLGYRKSQVAGVLYSPKFKAVSLIDDFNSSNKEIK